MRDVLNKNDGGQVFKLISNPKPKSLTAERASQHLVATREFK